MNWKYPTESETKFKCVNPYCKYGPAWDKSEPIPHDGPGGTVLEKDRADAYDQEPSRWKDGVCLNQTTGGYCLNCIDDRRKDIERAEEL